MNKKVEKEVKSLIKELNINCSIKEFQDKVNWYYISHSQTLSEEFIREFKDNVNWVNISSSQTLSEEFIREFKDNVNWYIISYTQTLSEEFIREFKDKVYWTYTSKYQKLSEEFIKEFKDKVYWYYISYSQKLSEEFIREFKDKANIEIYRITNKEKTLEQKRQEVKDYAEKHNLKFDEEFLYAFRNHDKFGRGAFNKTIKYVKGKYYRDWHCNMNENEADSFGLGIWPKGNTPIKVKIEDWGCEVNRNDGKGRVWGFEII